MNAETPTSPPKRAAIPRKNPIVCIIDDDNLSRDFAYVTLRKKYHVITARNGEEGLAMFKRFSPDLTLLDIEMPDISGIEVLKKFMAINPQSQVVMFSGHSTMEYVHEALEIGAQGFITKPFTPRAILNYAKRFLPDPEDEE